MPIEIPDGIDVNISGSEVSVESSGKKLIHRIPIGIKATMNDNRLIIKRENNSRKVRSQHGLTRTLLYNMVAGIKTGFKKRLEIRGRGKKGKVQGKNFILELGFSHPVNFHIPGDIEIKIEKNIIEVSGISKQKVGQVAAEIRHIQPPEPYKGAGIRYDGEVVKKKTGKTAVGGGFTGTGK